MLIYPSIKVGLTCHDIPSGPKSFDLYFSIKKAEKAAAYLMGKGIAKNRIYIRGCGSNYLISKVLPSSPISNKLNKRITVQLYDYEANPVLITFEEPVVPESLLDSKYLLFASAEKGLVYRIQIASVKQMFQNEILDQYSDSMIELDHNSENYRYTIGFSPTFLAAKDLRAELVGKGFSDAYIIPYINGLRIRQDEILDHAIDYPDILNFLDKSN
jgi:hypothetical protein